MIGGGAGGSSGGLNGEVGVSGEHQRQLKAEIATHPLYEQLLAAHVSCLRVATPIDQLPLIDAQLAQSHHFLRSYASQRSHSLSPHERQDLDNFLVIYMAGFSLTRFFSFLQYSIILLVFFWFKLRFSLVGFGTGTIFASLVQL